MFKNRKTRKETEINQQLENQNEFNSVTNSVKPENQNQEHNAKKQALGPNTRR